jgi:hypothetical protein
MEDRIPPFRVRVTGKTPTSPWAKILVFLFFISFLLLLFLHSPFSKVQEIRITGTSLLRHEEVLERVGIQIGDSFFQVDKRKLEQQIKELPEVQEVKVSKTFPNLVEVKVTEYPVIAFYRTPENRFLPILENGVILKNRPATKIEASICTFEGFAPNSSVFKKAVREFSLLRANERKLVWKIEPLSDRPDQLMLFTIYQHKLVVRLDNLHKKIPHYNVFHREPPGTVYLLESVWFSPE